MGKHVEAIGRRSYVRAPDSRMRAVARAAKSYMRAVDGADGSWR